jgi:dCMP deaminase
MIGATLYLVGKEMESGNYIENSNSCSMCKRLILNSGIERVIIRDSSDKYRAVVVSKWIEDDDSISEFMGY